MLTGEAAPVEQRVLDVEFVGERSGQSPLTWGQQGMWQVISRNPDSQFAIPVILTVPPENPTRVEAAARAVAALVERHEALRTTVREFDGEPRLVLPQSGRIAVGVVEVAAEDAAATARRLHRESRSHRFQRDTDLPFWAVLVVADGLVREILLVFDHLAVDLAGAFIAMEDLGQLLAGVPLPPAGLQPIDLARREQESGSTLTAVAVRTRVEQLRRLPLRMFTRPGVPAQPRTQVALMSSPALLAAGNLLARRHRTGLHTVLLASTAALIGAWTGRTTTATTVIVGNRFRPAFRRIVSNIQRSSLFLLDLADEATLDDLLSTAHGAVLTTYRRAYYEHSAMAQALAEVDAERGGEVNPFCCVNLSGQAADDVAADVEVPAGGSGAVDLRALRAATTMRWQENPSQVRCHFCLRFRNGFSGCLVSLSADTSYLPPAEMERFLRAMEEYLVASVSGSVRVADLRGWPTRLI